MTMPIVVSEQGALLLFESVADAERYLEAIDVEDGRYVAYDSEGGVLRLTTTDELRPMLFGLLRAKSKRVIVEAQVAQQDPGKLRDELVVFLGHLGVSAAELTDVKPLTALVSLAIEKAGFTK